MAGKYKKIVIVTGGSSGIGRCTASALRDSGCIVYEFSRRNIPMEGITHLSVDVTDENAVNSAVKQIIQKETKIDAVINCAGFGISGAVEFTSTDQAKAQFDVNFFGTVNVNKAVLPFMRHQGNGHIINISSVAAVAHIPFQTSAQDLHRCVRKVFSVMMSMVDASLGVSVRWSMMSKTV